MSFRLTWNLQMTSQVTGVDLDNIGPADIEVEGGVECLRRGIVLEVVDGFHTLEIGDLTPSFWILANVGAANNIDIGFGTGTQMTLLPGGLPAMWPGTAIAYAAAIGGQVTLLYAVYAIA